MNDTQNLTDIAPELAQKAIDLRAEYGYNCAQAVACALADAVAADSASLYAYTEGLGAGMGGHTETCGAISGAIVALSATLTAGIEKPGTTKGKTYQQVKKVVERFRKLNGTTLCGELKGIGTKAGMLRTCEGCIEDAVILACSVLDEARSTR